MWFYRDRDGLLLHAIARWDNADGKQILPLSWVRYPDDREDWAFKHHPIPRPLYGLNRLSAVPHADVVVVEGEKSVKAAEKIFPNSAVITSSGGAKAANTADWSVLAGRQTVLIWPDADEAGTTYGDDVASILHCLGVPNICIVDANALASRAPDGTTREPPPGWDVADALVEGWNLDVLRDAVLANATGFEIGPQYVSFGNFAMDADGLRVTLPKVNGEIATYETKWVCAPFEILGRARDPKGEGWARLIRWHDDDGRVHTDTISDEDLHGDVPALCARLAHCGLRIGTGK